MQYRYHLAMEKDVPMHLNEPEFSWHKSFVETDQLIVIKNVVQVFSLSILPSQHDLAWAIGGSI